MRVVLLIAAVAALLWSVTTFETVWRAASIERLSSSIIAGDRYDAATLERVLDRVNAHPAVAASAIGRRASALIQIRLYELAREKVDPDVIDRRGARLSPAIRESLALTPADAFLWYALFWQDGVRTGFQEGTRYLARSYELGPREQWIAERRNRSALASFAKLDAGVQDLVVAEFAGLLDSNLVPLVADNLTGPGWPIRDRLLAGLEATRPEHRLALKRQLSRSGVRVDIPGLANDQERPWQ